MQQPVEVRTSVAPRERPKSSALPSNTNLGLPVQTSIAPRKRPTACAQQTSAAATAAVAAAGQ